METAIYKSKKLFGTYEENYRHGSPEESHSDDDNAASPHFDGKTPVFIT